MSSSYLLSTAPATTPRSSSSSSFPIRPRSQLFSGVWLYGAKDNRDNADIRPRCRAISKPRSQEYPDDFQKNGSPVVKWHEIVEDDKKEQVSKVSISHEKIKRIQTIKSMLNSMEDGETSISAYDTAWVALVEDVNGSGAPQFPSSLEWIAKNQLPDGSWGDADIFISHDRIINTLACVIALKSWNIHPDKCEKGMKYFKENLCKLEDENAEHMPIGFEVVFPSLLELARKLDIEVPEDSPVLQEIYASRNLKLTKIPKDIMHKVPTTLLHSLEGMPGLEWDKLLKLQCQDGSFLFSPSSTAFALMQTKDENCLAYLNKIVQRFKGGVPNGYPVDLFEHIWAVDRLHRLGISRYFEQELKECVDYVARYWREDGICWARNSEVHDIDDTAMGFRVLRLYGHEVSSDVFKHFKKGDTFFCFAGQSSQAVTGMFNLYRASQVLFPGEKILEEAKEFSSSFLKEKQAANGVVDKWIITKDLPGEVEYSLDVPWYANLPRVEARFYLEQYGGEDDVWIGKTLYRMPYVNNNEYLQLARLDYNSCQALHRVEWDNFQKWYEGCNLGDFGISKRELLFAYFLAAASIFEPERSKERLAWAKTTILFETIDRYFDDNNNSTEQRRAFVQEFKNGVGARGPVNGRTMEAKTRQELVRTVLGTLNDVSLYALVAYGRDISHSLRHAWEKWLLEWEEEGVRHQGEAELIVKTINLAAGRWISEELLSYHSQYEKLFKLTNRICNQLGHYRKNKEHDSKRSTTPEIEGDMQELVKLVLQKSSEGMDSNIKETFFTVVKSFYYPAICDPGTISYHISKVLFEKLC
ncbi:ent-copalyl diphosphate synthase 1-like [Hevea brasiliensis]|uniref:ent-copalyl diphosphate synthase 1-like n=1 Tax=Hevea brasiliensis TaxID=3981 RepID=UPI0025EC3000|nr:ent-copalyl diphosphate synthase 1-like [Hevea brasiliensis]